MLKLVMTQMGARLDKASAFAGTVLFGIVVAPMAN
jgi:hypothetical protein